MICHHFGNTWYRLLCRQVALLLQRDRARHSSVEIVQLQNISLENHIAWHYLRDSTFSRFDTIPECDRHTHTHRERHTTTAYTALSIASRGKKSTILHRPPIIITTAGNERRSIAKSTVIITYLKIMLKLHLIDLLSTCYTANFATHTVTSRIDGV